MLATTDLHGYLVANQDLDRDQWVGGLVEIAATWREREGYRPEEETSAAATLVLDSGDMWTGPAESTLARGRPLVEAFNALGYDAAALGNHEFDFGIPALRDNAGSLQAPLLAANLSATVDGPTLDFAQASVLLSAGGVDVGVIGLATTRTPVTTHPEIVKQLRFGDYEPAVRAEAERLLAEGAELLIVVAHVSLDHLRPVAEATADLPIVLFLGGHDHREGLEVLERDASTVADDVVLASAGPWGRSYARIELRVLDGRLMGHTQELVPVTRPRPSAEPVDSVVGAIAARAQAEVAARMNEPVGVLRLSPGSAPLARRELGALVADSWLAAVPAAEIAVVNRGGIRDSLASGPVTIGDLFSVLPFDNFLVLTCLTAEGLREVLALSPVIVGGVRYRYQEDEGGRTVVAVETQAGQPLPERSCHPVVTTDFLYAGGDGLPFARLDPTPEPLEIHWRAPFVDLFRRAAGAGVEPDREERSITVEVGPGEREGER